MAGGGGNFGAGLSGLSAAQRGLEVISNNVSNASTVGFKSSSAQFADVAAQYFAGGNTLNAGLGTSVTAVRQTFSQGGIRVTGNPLDMAISGTGFFKVQDPKGKEIYTRNGQFSLDGSGNVINAQGGKLVGYEVDKATGLISDQQSPIKINQASLPPSATRESLLTVNLDARKDGTATAFDPTDLASYEHSTTITVYDQLGQSQAMNVYFKKQPGSDTWDVHAQVDGTDLTLTPATLDFDASGNLADPTQALLSVDISGFDADFSLDDAVTGGTANTFTLDLRAATQFGSPFEVQDLSQDGYESSVFAGFDINDKGILELTYVNGEVREAYKIGLFKFKNPEGLQPVGAAGWIATDAAGPELTSTSEETAFGSIQSGALEEANVDLTAELVNMISAQRVYQANSQSIKTQDQILQVITNLK